MCNPDKNLKLCTCGDVKDTEQLREKLWKLIRSDRKEFFVIGEAKVSYLMEDPEADYLLDQLNSEKPFDFDFEPSAGDKLEIKWNESKEYKFVYSGKVWERLIDDAF